MEENSFFPPGYASDASFLQVWDRCCALSARKTRSGDRTIVVVSVDAVRELLLSEHILHAAYLYWTHSNPFLSQAIRACTTLLLSWLEERC